MAEFGLHLPETIALTVHDSNADMRYLVLLEPPDGFENMDVDRLEAMVSRDPLIGVARRVPS